MADNSRDISAIVRVRDAQAGSKAENAGTKPAIPISPDNGKPNVAQPTTTAATDQTGAAAGPSDITPPDTTQSDTTRSSIGLSGTHVSGQGPLGTDPTAIGPTATGPTATGPSASGPTASGPTATGPSAAGPSATGPAAAHMSDSAPGAARQAAAPPPAETLFRTADPGSADPKATDRRPATPHTAQMAQQPPQQPMRQTAAQPAGQLHHPAPATPSVAEAPSPQRRGNRLFGVLAVVSIAAAGISLTAPALRPELAHLSAAWFGAENPVTAWLLPPPPPVDVERDLAALIPRVAQLEAGLRGVTGDLRRMDARLAEAGSTLHEGLGSLDSIARMAQDALRRTEGIEAASQDLTNRIRAASLMALATRLRRDVDVGAPLAENALLLSLYGPYPPAIERAIEDLMRMPDGALTMRDLAVGFEALEARIQAVTGLDSSWSARGWNRVRSLFGAAPTDLEAAIGERLHVLATEGRFTEAADLLERSPWKELGAVWLGQVRDRASAARAAQLVMAHAVAVARATQGVSPRSAPQQPTPQQPTSAQPPLAPSGGRAP